METWDSENMSVWSGRCTSFPIVILAIESMPGGLEREGGRERGERGRAGGGKEREGRKGKCVYSAAFVQIKVS